jgi:hypothetical protein
VLGGAGAGACGSEVPAIGVVFVTTLIGAVGGLVTVMTGATGAGAGTCAAITCLAICAADAEAVLAAACAVVCTWWAMISVIDAAASSTISDTMPWISGSLTSVTFSQPSITFTAHTPAAVPAPVSAARQSNVFSAAAVPPATMDPARAWRNVQSTRSAKSVTFGFTAVPSGSATCRGRAGLGRRGPRGHGDVVRFEGVDEQLDPVVQAAHVVAERDRLGPRLGQLLAHGGDLVLQRLQQPHGGVGDDLRRGDVALRGLVLLLAPVVAPAQPGAEPASTADGGEDLRGGRDVVGHGFSRR